MSSIRKELRKLVCSMIMKKALIFPDGSTYNYTLQSLGLPIGMPFFVPVPTGKISENRKKQIRNRNLCKELSFGWLGRISDFKMPTLMYTVKKLSQYAVKKRFPITMHIIGDGSGKVRLKKMNAENEYFQIHYVGTLTGRFRDKYLVDKVDVLAAMGTSALDGARLGIPTLLLDIAYSNVSDGYIYRWIFDVRDFSMGEILNNSHFEKGNDSLESAICSAKNEYMEISAKSFEYCMRNHSISSVCGKFINALEEASFYYGDFSPAILKKGFIRKSYEFMRRTINSF